MAGVIGPCPTCNTVIQAPIPHPQPPAHSAYSPPPQPQPVHPPQPAPSPPYHASVLLPQREEKPTLVRVEPRDSKVRSGDSPEMVARPMAEDTSAGQPEYHYSPASRSHRPKPFPRILIALSVLALMGAVSFGLIKVLTADDDQSHSTSPPIRKVEILPDTPIQRPVSLDPPQAPKPPAEPEIPEAPEKIVPPPARIHAGVAAMRVLEKFLEASSLAERLPLIDTKLSPADLENTVLAKPFPADPRISPDIQETNRAENFTDIFYNVEFRKPDGKYDPYLILLRARGDEEPKVIIDPFLDSYGGRLLQYAGAPSDKLATFQVVASAVARVTSDQKIPNHEQKLWLKLLPRDNEKEITSAFFTRSSKIGQMLTEDSSGFRYGQAKPVRVVLRWNVEEDPKMPYLEAVDIKELRWNP